MIQIKSTRVVWKKENVIKSIFSVSMHKEVGSLTLYLKF